jgi:hypothetical protein
MVKEEPDYSKMKAYAINILDWNSNDVGQYLT